MESFLVNITSDQGPKFLQTQMEFELTDAATEDEVTRKKSAIRDAIIVLLSSRSYKQIRETTGMVTLRHDILRAVNNLLSNGKVREVYFTQFHFN
jgi:flagellar FliL protein